MPLKIVKASAGSGKTFFLIQEYLLLALAESPSYFSRIIGMTFTNKAAWEMKERILEELYLLAVDPHSSQHLGEIQKLSAFDGGVEKIKSKAQIVLSEILIRYHDFSLSTIDSFFQRIVRAFFRELGLSTNYDVELDQKKVVDDAINDYLEKMDKNDPLVGYILRIVEEMIDGEKGFNYKRELVKLSFELFKELNLPDTKKNSGGLLEIREQIFEAKKSTEGKFADLKNQLKITLEKYDIDTNEFSGKGRSFPNMILTREGVTVYELKDKTTFLKAIDNVEKWYAKSATQDTVERIHAAYEEINSILKSIHSFMEETEEDYTSNDLILKNFNSFAVLSYLNSIIESYTAENNLFLLSKTYELLRNFVTESDTPLIYERIGNHYRNLFIDEFQDTSAYQYENIKPLIRESLATGQKSLIVGDIKQAIYRFRNGDWRLLAEKVKADFALQVEEEFLFKNWRSMPEIIYFNNGLYSDLATKMTDAFNLEMLNEWPGGAEFVDFQYIKKIYQEESTEQKVPDKRPFKHPGHVQMEFLFEEPPNGFEDALIQRLERQLLELEEIGYSAGDVAILCRKNEQLKTLIKHLAGLQEKHPESEIFGFYSEEVLSVADSPLVEMVLSVMRISICGSHNQKERQKMLLQLKYFSQKSGIQLSFFENNSELFIPSDSPIPVELKEVINNGQASGLLGFFSNILSVLGLGAKVNRSQFYYLAGLADELESYVDQNGNDLKGFLEYWEEKGSEKNIEPPANPNKLNLMTIHKAKGLAFPIVILPYANQSLNPPVNPIVWVDDARFKNPEGKSMSFPIFLNQKMNRAHFNYKKEYWLEIFNNWMDELNSFYVATTRPKEALFVYGFGKLPRNKSHTNLADHLINYAGENLIENESESNLDHLRVFVKKANAAEILKPGEREKDEKTVIGIDSLHARKFLPDIKSQWIYGGAGLCSDSNSSRSPIEEGLVMHQILERVVHKTDVSKAVKMMIEEGVISESEFDYWESRINNAIMLDPVLSWFSGENEILNERDILLPDGRRYRPDRVVLKDQKTVIIDYKTGQPHPKYQNQLLTYTQILKKMGHHNVESWLFYTDGLRAEKVS